MSEAGVNLWDTAAHALEDLSHQDRIPHRTEGEAALLESLPTAVSRVLDLGSGDGRLLSLVRLARPGGRAVALDFSETMLERLRARFADDPSVTVVAHDLSQPLPDSLGMFDCIVSSFAIHHVTHARKRVLYEEVYPDGSTRAVRSATSSTSHRRPARCTHSSFARSTWIPQRRIPRTSCSTSKPSSDGSAGLASQTWIATGSGASWRCSQV